MSLSPRICQEIDHWLKRYPADRKESAVLVALREAQHENNGYLTVELMDAVAEYLGMPQTSVYEVASFYSMFETKPVGRHCISVCTNISCMLNDSEQVVEHLQNKLGISLGESTPDGKFYLKKEEECLAACCGAPVMQVNHKYYENLTSAKIDNIISNLD